MKQILHIFLKDVLQYWREGAAAIALLAAFVRDEVYGWSQPGGFTSGVGAMFGLRFLAGSVTVLLPMVWAFVIVRVIQGESLVGDRQFWITRPYEWKKLLVAKILFVFAFVNLPLFIADVFLLAKAGFPIVAYATGLLTMQVLITVFFFLPVAGLAVVTRTVTQALLAFLMIALYMIGMAWLSSQIPSSSFSGPADSILGALFIATCIVVIVLQYARRQTAASRLVIASLAIAFLVILIATPYQAIVAHEFPQLSQGQQLPFQISLLPPPTDSQFNPVLARDRVELQLPMSVAGIEPGSILVIDGFMIEIRTPSGSHWNSGWISPGIHLFPDTKQMAVSFEITKKRFEQMKASPVNARVSLAFTSFRDADQKNFVVPHGEFEIPGVGHCFANFAPDKSIHCLAPLRRPASLLISINTSDSTCPKSERESPSDEGKTARSWTQTDESGAAELGISPIKKVDLFLWLWPDSGVRSGAGLCPGTPAILSTPHAVRRNQGAIELNLQLADYKLAENRFSVLQR